VAKRKIPVPIGNGSPIAQAATSRYTNWDKVIGPQQYIELTVNTGSYFNSTSTNRRFYKNRNINFGMPLRGINTLNHNGN
jgi:hypothetical protein